MTKTSRKTIPSQDVLNNLLRYEPDTGHLFWKHRSPSTTFNARFAGKEAFTSRTAKGYRQGHIDHVHHLAHRLIWKMVHGSEPHEIDHINGNGLDNRLANLRAVDHGENLKNQRLRSNNSSGFNGVYWNKDCSRWQAYIRVNGRARNLGVFIDIEDAKAARMKANAENRFHYNHGCKRG